MNDYAASVITIGDIEIRQSGGARWYKRAGAEWVPSVTTVLNQIFWRPPVEAEPAIEYARDRGREVHRAVEYLCRGIAYVDLNLDPEVAPRVQRFAEWQQRTGWKSVYVEEPFVHSVYGYGCTADVVGYFGAQGSPWHILEVKTAVAPLVGLQLSAQALAVKERHGLQYAPGRTALYLTDKTARALPLNEHARDRDAWLACLSTFNVGIEKRIWRRA